MKQKPLSLLSLSFSFYFFAFVAVVELFFSWQMQSITYFQFYSLAFVLLNLWGALGMRKDSPTSLLAVMLGMWCFILTAYYTLFTHSALSLYQQFVFDLYAALVFFQTSFCCSGVLRILSQPTKHWWKTPKRIPSDIRAIVRLKNGDSYLAEIRNISKEGMLVGLNAQSASLRLKEGEVVNIHFVLQAYRPIKCSAKVVRYHATDTQSFTPYYGLKVSRIGIRSKQQIEQFIEKAAA